MKRQADRYDGLLLLAKSPGLSSHDVVLRVRKIVGQRSVGHAGTLDPAAEGLLVILLGRATKIAQYLTAEDKTYEAEICLGRTSATYDAEGVDPEIAPRPVPQLSNDLLKTVLNAFRGTILQKVPPYSAVHVDGERLYRLSRRGEEVEVPTREVHISALELVSFEADRFLVRLTCSKGTYVRSLAHDIGERLGCGGYLSYLKRIASGRFQLNDALNLEEVEQRHRDGNLEPALLGLDQALALSVVTVNETFSPQVRYGRRPRGIDIDEISGDFESGDAVLLKDSCGRVLAIGKAEVAASRLSRESNDEVITYNRVLA